MGMHNRTDSKTTEQIQFQLVSEWGKNGAFSISTKSIHAIFSPCEFGVWFSFVIAMLATNIDQTNSNIYILPPRNKQTTYTQSDIQCYRPITIIIAIT